MIRSILIALAVAMPASCATAETADLSADLTGRWTELSRTARENALPMLCTDPASGRYEDALKPLAELATPASQMPADERGAVANFLAQNKAVNVGYSDRRLYEAYMARLEVFAKNAAAKEEDRRPLLERCWLRAETKRCAENKPDGSAPARPGRYEADRCARIASATDAASAMRAVAGDSSGTPGSRMHLGSVGGSLGNLQQSFGANVGDGLNGNGTGGLGTLSQGNTGRTVRPSGGGNTTTAAGTSSPNTGTIVNGTSQGTSDVLDFAALNRTQGQEVTIPGRLTAARPDEIPPPAATSGAAGARTVTDPTDPAQQYPVSPASADDIKKIVDTFHWSVARMVSKGQRSDGSGSFMGWWTDFQSDWTDANKKKCYDQAHLLLHDLAATFGTSYNESGSAPQFRHGNWTFKFTTFAGSGEDANGHFWVTAVSSAPQDPSIKMDPWRNEIEFIRGKDISEQKPWTSRALGAVKHLF